MTQKPLTLESSPDSSTESKSRDFERRRVPRLNLTTEQFRLTLDDHNGKIFSVADISSNGMALRVLERADLHLFPVGRKISGILNLRREKYSIQANVRHLGGEIVGCSFEGLGAVASEALRQFLDPALLGRELKPIPSSEAGTLWYYGPSGTHLLFWRGTDGQYRRFAASVLGTYAQWEVSAGVSTGRMSFSSEPSEIRGVVRFETMLLDKDEKPDWNKISVAKTLILNSVLSQDLKNWCVRHLEGGEAVPE